MLRVPIFPEDLPVILHERFYHPQPYIMIRMHTLAFHHEGESAVRIAVSAAEFQDLIFRHWEVENCLYLQKDRSFEEDKHVLGRDSWSEAWTILTSMALSLT